MDMDSGARRLVVDVSDDGGSNIHARSPTTPLHNKEQMDDLCCLLLVVAIYASTPVRLRLSVAIYLASCNMMRGYLS
ncbi:hypothetical protein M404DRAFT_35839 [Pisolithus tinctorius Marx 270]|uniref:Uncharacterized protein n=1 Tax=Pisolithus tinctorius Marx 270 TaxID=870435 RepID=A0A0C3NDP5_PISTI|nr:hypothetical protein M404DRAFT_35839 [Pisolithus tinctorius Marx 270]